MMTIYFAVLKQNENLRGSFVNSTIAPRWRYELAWVLDYNSRGSMLGLNDSKRGLKETILHRSEIQLMKSRAKHTFVVLLFYYIFVFFRECRHH